MIRQNFPATISPDTPQNKRTRLNQPDIFCNKLIRYISLKSINEHLNNRSSKRLCYLTKNDFSDNLPKFLNDFV